MRPRYYFSLAAMLLLFMGLGWSHVQAQIPSPPHPIYTTNKDAAKVYALAVDPNSHDGLKILAGTGNFDDPDQQQGGSVHESTDLGENWPLSNPLFYGYPIRALLVVDANTYLAGAFQNSPAKAGSSPGIFYTNDGGANWQQVLHGEQITSFAVSGNGVYFAGTQDGDIYVSTNPGTAGSWTSLRNLNRPVLSLETTVDGGTHYLFAGTDADGLYVYTVPGGVALADFSHQLAGMVVSALEADGNRIYIGTQDGVYKGAPPYNVSTSYLSLAGMAGNWVRALYLHTIGAQKYLFAGSYTSGTGIQEGGVRYSTDDGATWTRLNNGLQSMSILSFTAVDVGAETYVFVGTEGEGIHRIKHDGTSFGPWWEQMTNVERIVAINAVEVVDQNIFLGTYGYGVLHARAEDAPTNNWTELNKGLDNPWVYSLLYKPAITFGGVTTGEYLFAGTWNNGVYRRPLKRDGSGHINDLGTSWQQVGATSLTGLIIYDMDYAPTGRIFAATSLGEIAYSDNDGLTWTKVAFTDTLNRRVNTAIYALQVDRDSYIPGTSPTSDPDRCTIYAGTFGYGIFKSTDCGLTWSQTGLTNKHVWEITIDYNGAGVGDNIIFAATSEGVWESRDGGATWTDITGNLTSFFPYSRDVRSVFLYDQQVLWAGVYGGGLYRLWDTDNDGDYAEHSWENDGFEGMHILSFAVHPDTKDLLVLTPNELWVLPTATATASEGDAIGVPKELDLLQNYPNPFDGKTVISFTLPKAGEVEVKVFDILGREVATVVSGRFQAGVHRVTWESGRLPSGVYIYQLRADGRTKTRKMMIVH